MKPPLTRMTHTLPFEKLSAVEFERLCLWLISKEGFKPIEALGEAGADSGQDLVAWKDDRRVAFQCKRVRKFGPTDARAEVLKVRELPVDQRPDTLIFLVACAVTDRTRREAERVWGNGKSCDFWAGSELDHKVKQHPEIVKQFFDLGDSGLDSSRDLHHEILSDASSDLRPKSLVRKVPRLLLTMLAILAIVGLLEWVYDWRFIDPVISEKSKVLVLPFSGVGPVESWFPTALQQLISLDLGDAVRVVSERELEAFDPPLAIPTVRAASLGKSARENLAGLGGDNYQFVVWGIYEAVGREGNAVRATVHIQPLDQENQFPPRTIRKIAKGDLVEGAHRVSQVILDNLGLDTSRYLSPSVQPLGQRPDFPQTVTSKFSDGLKMLESLEFRDASVLLSELVGQHPRHLGARVALAEAQWGLGRYEAPKREQTELEEDHQLKPTERIFLRAIVLETEGKCEEASSLYNVLLRMRNRDTEPEPFRVRVRLARCQMKTATGPATADDWARVQDSIDRLTKQADSARQRARASLLQLEMGFQSWLKGDGSLMENDGLTDTVEEAINLGEQVGLGIISAEAKYYYGRYLLSKIDRGEEALSLLDDALKVYEGAEHQRRAADVLFYESIYHFNSGSLDAADRLSKDAIAYYRAFGDHRMERIATHNRGLVRRYLDGYTAEVEIYDEFLGAFSEPQFRARRSLTLLNKVIALSAQGKFSGAEVALGKAKDLSDGSELGFESYAEARLKIEQGDLARVSSLLNKARSDIRRRAMAERARLALIAFFLDLGDLDTSEEELDVMYEEYQGATSEKRNLPLDYYISRALLKLAQGDLPVAKAELEHAAVARDLRSNPLAQARLLVAEAKVANAEGEHEGTLRLLREAILRFSSRQAWMEQARAQLLLANTLLDQGRFLEAQAEITAARNLGQEQGARVLEFRLGLAEARVKAMKQDPEAQVFLSEVCAQASSLYGTRFEFEADLAEMEVRSVLGIEIED